MSLPDGNEEQFVSELENRISTMSYPNCDSELVFDGLKAYYTATYTDTSHEDELMDLVDRILSPVREYTDVEDESDVDNISDSALAASMCVHTWYEVMGGRVEYGGQRMKLGDVLNDSIGSNELGVAESVFEKIEDYTYDMLGRSMKDIDIDGPYEEVVDRLEVSIPEMLGYYVLLMSFDRLVSGDELSDRAMNIP